MTYQPHPAALLLPTLTDEEYQALKADIAEHGILYPIILDENDLVLDGVHRARIADELGINLLVSRHHDLDDDRKLHLAVGLNMRRRHLDADRRRELVRRLHKDEGLSVRKIASITGWSKSTVDRDLKTSPFEMAIAEVQDAARTLHAKAEAAPSEAAAGVLSALGDGVGVFGPIFEFMDQQWKRGNWPLPAEERDLLLQAVCSLQESIEGLLAKVGVPSGTGEHQDGDE